MATPYSLSIFWNFVVLFFSLFHLKKGHAFEREDYKDNIFLIIPTPSLVSSSICNHSPQGPKGKSSLKVVYKYGPCSHLHQNKANIPTLAQIFAHDQSRFNSIQSRISSHRGKGNFQESQTTIPANLGGGGFFVTVGLGTPKKDISLTFDTGSVLTWTQCEPCVGSCYAQEQPIFDPSMSITYSNITCTSPLCNDLPLATGSKSGCTGSTCLYAMQYGDGSTTVGYFAKDKLTISPTDELDGFLFGCGQRNKGIFGNSAGLLGLGQNKLSIISQNAQKYENYFSYCLPSDSSSTGYLTLGKDGVSNNLQYTPFASSRGLPFYFINLTEIYVGETKLSINPTVFSKSGTIIDSGTTITRLPLEAYNALSTEFQNQMTAYPKAPAVSPTFLDTCYNFSNFDTVTTPNISLMFGGNVKIDATKTLIGTSLSQVCLAFAANMDSSGVGILGSVQHVGLEVVYDVGGGKLGFGASGCA